MTTRYGNALDVTARPYNNLLRRLSEADYALIAPHLTRDRRQRQRPALQSRRRRRRSSTFPADRVSCPHLVSIEDGRDVETILVGREGAVGGIVSEGYLPAYTRIVVKFGGPFLRLHVSKLDAAKMYSATLRNVFARYADCMLAQIFQSTACNAIHSIEQRTAKWIIAAMERTDDPDAVPLTHEQLATLLGVGRCYASRVIQTVQGGGRAGDPARLDRGAQPRGPESAACRCNESVKTHFEEVLRGVYPTEEAQTN